MLGDMVVTREEKLMPETLTQSLEDDMRWTLIKIKIINFKKHKT